MILEVYKGGNEGEVRKTLNRLCSEEKKKGGWRQCSCKHNIL